MPRSGQPYNQGFEDQYPVSSRLLPASVSPVSSIVGPAIVASPQATPFDCGQRRLQTENRFHPASLAANTSTKVPTMRRYTANGANPRFRTQAMNHATEAYATRKDTTKPIAKMSHCCGMICDTQIGFSPFPITDLSKVYPVAASMVGKDTKNENSRAEARDIPAICPAAIVDMDRDTPGNTAERIWQAPIQIACPRLMASICQVCMRLFGPSGGAFRPAASDRALIASTIHITMPPISSELPMM